MHWKAGTENARLENAMKLYTMLLCRQSTNFYHGRKKYWRNDNKNHKHWWL